MNGILVKPCNDVNDAYWVPTLKLNYIVNDVQENQQHQLDTPYCKNIMYIYISMLTWKYHYHIFVCSKSPKATSQADRPDQAGRPAGLPPSSHRR